MLEKIKKVVRPFRFIAISISTIIIFFLIVSWLVGHNTNHFSIGNDYEVTLKSSQCMTCFMDWDIDFEIQINDSKSGDEKEFQFHSPGGPQFIFATTKPNGILIKGYGESEGLNWLIDLNKNTITDLSHGEVVSEYEAFCKLTTNFEIIKTKN
jgi:hypothetical protein